ncbi:hypothetical protein [Ammoniphilus sp. CFH 90114]|uniref:hypothetical protein n=1 Tax=Ammoniphilus sp. CFH 90114 TaxID=2493665 RepID=UPI0013E9896C|nr:hypothetical protein [Ammoniphilus sp. CFH 90114]
MKNIYARVRVRKGNRVMNGVMAQNEKEMKRLGKEMESMETQQEMNKQGIVSDPIQNKR